MNVSFAKFGFGTTVKLDEIHVIGFQALKTAVDASEQRLWTPIRITPTALVSTFRQKITVFASFPYGFTDELFTGGVAFGSVDHINTRIDGFIKQFFSGGQGGVLIADLRAAKTENANIQICFAQPAIFHVSSSKKNWTRFNRS
jgi:hypothetical protein